MGAVGAWVQWVRRQNHMDTEIQEGKKQWNETLISADRSHLAYFTYRLIC